MAPQKGRRLSVRCHDLREYSIWSNIITRCENKNSPNHSNYGARGVRMCERWRSSFWAFFADVGRSPSNLHSIERIDNNGNYEPGNIRWATRPEQQRNTRRNRVITFNGTTLVLSDWAKRLGVGHKTIAYRLTRGWPLDKALTLKASNSNRVKVLHKSGPKPKAGSSFHR